MESGEEEGYLVEVQGKCGVGGLFEKIGSLRLRAAATANRRFQFVGPPVFLERVGKGPRYFGRGKLHSYGFGLPNWYPTLATSGSDCPKATDRAPALSICTGCFTGPNRTPPRLWRVAHVLQVPRGSEVWFPNGLGLESTTQKIRLPRRPRPRSDFLFFIITLFFVRRHFIVLARLHLVSFYLQKSRFPSPAPPLTRRQPVHHIHRHLLLPTTFLALSSELN